jgi:multiple sugar transport system permease protein
MTASEISANYGSIFAQNNSGGKVYVSEFVNLKFIPDMVTFSQYATVLFKSPEYLMKFWNSVIYVVPIVIFQLLVASLASFGFARYRGRVKQLIFFIYIVLMLMPYQVTLVPNFMVSSELGIIGTRWAIWLPGIFSPFAVYMLTKYMRRIPYSLYEAASIDGASRIKRIWHITLPTIRPTIATLLILAVGGILSTGFEQQLLMGNNAILNYSDVLDTYAYRYGLAKGMYSYGTAVGLFKSIVSFILVMSANKITAKLNDSALF